VAGSTRRSACGNAGGSEVVGKYRRRRRVDDRRAPGGATDGGDVTHVVRTDRMGMVRCSSGRRRGYVVVACGRGCAAVVAMRANARERR